MERNGDPIGAERVRRQKTVLAIAVVGFLVVSIAGLSSLVVLELARERRRNEELARREAQARVGQPAGDLAATPTGSYRCARVAAPPLIDGALDDPEWSAASWRAAPSGGAGEEPLAARWRLVWDDRALFAAGEVAPAGGAELAVELLVASERNLPGGTLGVAIAPDGSVETFRWSGDDGPRGEAPPADVAAGAVVEHGVAGGGRVWGFELAIPWNALEAAAGGAPAPGDRLRVAVRPAGATTAPPSSAWSAVELAPGGR